MGVLHLVMFYSFTFSLFYQEIHIAAYTLTPSQSIIDGQTLISKGAIFELGFFSPSNSKDRYLGIWYKKVSVQTVVWVANRDSPLNDTSGALKIGSIGNIVILNRTQSVIWSSNTSNAVENPIVELLDSGNLVLRDVKDADPKSYLWQSFDYPGDTLLPGMKLGWNLKTGRNTYMSSWRNSDDPSQGDYTFAIDLTKYPESVIRNRYSKYYRSGPWDGLQFSGAPNLVRNRVFKYEVVLNADEVYYTYQVIDQSVTLRVVLTQTSTEGHLQRLTWVNDTQSWRVLVSIPRDHCDDYALCGAYSTCEVMSEPACQCLKGFKPKSPLEWDATDWSQGCERKTPTNCSQGDEFLKFTGVKVPDTTGTWANMSMDLEECRVICLTNCSCVAYTNADISNGGSGCVMWFMDLTDIRNMDEDGAGQDLYIRMAASELVSESKSRTKEHVVVIVSITAVAGMAVLGLGSWCIWSIWKKRSPRGDHGKDDLELPIFDLATIKNATDNFAEANKLGEGGFGPVYKGKLEGEQEIAVKRLSKNSIQGLSEFKNEVILISKLQHKNLVKLLGFCMQGEEKMLVYEYMPNKSLDSFIFDETTSRLLDKQKRVDIILGIARDFGMARLFRGDQNEANTERVMGTYGYMSPEYAVDGHFSVKSDVFSFGVLVLEIISGKKNRGFFHPDHELNLLGHAWRLWSEDRSMELVDESMGNSCGLAQEILRCIHIGLLCVQKGADQRPTMSSVVLMLSSETVVLPKPLPPGFYFERSTPIKDTWSYSDKESCVSYDSTISMVEAR
ncbi:hypothetical protein IFM89_020547 [Coptis chinensis]|uniref:Receptor-like serine/threonine-protein kinase n=1 Tax=Coptis chinensis TaxID=261450 RepID=A0A835LM78_9MAGN|nr:hypothetical protein IFM89_020547 [Coptis chinensis]